MIPKRIHYCWFGGNPLPELAQKCIASWKKFCPDYEIIEWNEQNFDVNINLYCKAAFEAKKWAFVSDVARLYALVHEGGIYMDTDVEVLKPLDCFLECEAFSGFEAADRIPTGIMASEKGHALFAELLADYETTEFYNKDGSMNLTTNVSRITEHCLKHGLQLNNKKQTVYGFTLYPNDYFCPKDCITKVLTLTENSYTIHHFDGSWLSDEEKYMGTLKSKYCKFFPVSIAGRLARFVTVVHYHGFSAAVSAFAEWLRKN